MVPIKSDSEHYPPDGKLRVYRSRSGGNEWEALTKGLPQQDCYVNVLRDAMAVDSLDSCGVYFGTTGGQVYASRRRRRQLGADRARPAGRAVGRGADPRHDPRGAAVASAEPGQASAAKLSSTCRPPVTQRLDSRRPRGPLPDARAAPSATTARSSAEPSSDSSPASEDVSHEPPDAPVPGSRWRAGTEPFLVVGATAGG